MSADTIWPVLVVQSFVDAVTCALIAALGALVDARVGLIAGALAALWPNMIVHSQLILGDSLFLFFAAAGLYVSAQCLLKPRIAYAAAAGIVFGLMTLVRSVGLLIPFAMVAIFLLVELWRGHGLKRAIGYSAAALVIFAVMISPILWRNVTNFGTWQLTSQSGTHFLLWVVNYSKSIETGITFEAGSKQLQDKLAARLDEARKSKPELNDFDYSDIAMGLAKEEVRNLPLLVIARSWVSGMMMNFAAPAIVVDPRIRDLNSGSFMNMAAKDTIERLVVFLSQNDPGYLAWVIFGLAVGSVVTLLQISGWLILSRENFLLAMIFLGWIVYFFLVTGPVISPKYRLPIEPVLIIAQAIAISTLVSRFWGDRAVHRGT